MAGASGTFNGGINYGNTNLPNPISTLPNNLFQGTGVNGLTQPTWYNPQTFTPTDITSQYNNEQAVQGAYNDLANNFYQGPNAATSISRAFNGGSNFGDISSDLLTQQGRYGLSNDQQQQALKDLGVIEGVNGFGSGGSVGPLNDWLNNQNNSITNTQNQNIAGYDATNAANGQNAQFLNQAAIAQNQLLGELNQRGLLQSYLNGGLGTADMANLSNNLQNAVNDQGQGLQNILSGLANSQQQYELNQNNFQNALNNFGYNQAQQQPGFTDILGTGASALKTGLSFL